MCPTWLIEAGVYGEEISPLLAEIRRQGAGLGLVTHAALAKGATPLVDGRPLADDACVIAYGTFPFIRHVQLHRGWRPGGWCDSVRLDCSAYYPHFARFLLNHPCSILPGMEAIRRRDALFDEFAVDGEVFARPAGCDKLFVGRRVSREAFAGALSPARYDPATQVVIARPREIGHEWRMVVIGDRVVAGSQYAADGTREVVGGLPQEVRAFADRVLSEVSWRPDPIFMLDVGECDGRLWLVELNGFSTSWLYACDVAAVVRGAAELAQVAGSAG